MWLLLTCFSYAWQHWLASASIWLKWRLHFISQKQDKTKTRKELLSWFTTSGNICRHCSWAGDRRRDRSHQTSVRHLGDDGERSEPDGEHRRERDDPGEDAWLVGSVHARGYPPPLSPSGPGVHQLHSGGTRISSAAQREYLHQRHQRAPWKGEANLTCVG